MTNRRVTLILDAEWYEWLLSHGHAQREGDETFTILSDEPEPAGACVECGDDDPAEGQHQCPDCLTAEAMAVALVDAAPFDLSGACDEHGWDLIESCRRIIARIH